MSNIDILTLGLSWIRKKVQKKSKKKRADNEQKKHLFKVQCVNILRKQKGGRKIYRYKDRQTDENNF